MNTIASLVETGYPVFRLGDTVGDVLERLADAGLSVAPVLDGRRYLAIIRLSDLLTDGIDGHEDNKPLSALSLPRVPASASGEYLFDTVRKMGEAGDDIVPVIDSEGDYEGVVSRRALLRFLAGVLHTGEGSATLEIEVPSRGTRVSEVMSVIEKNDASVMSFCTQPAGISGNGIVLMIRVMTHDFYRLVKNMEKYGYLIRYHSSFPDGGYDELREKALEFIRYIDM